MDKNATVPKAIGLIQVKEQAGSLSLQDQKIINALLYYSHEDIVNVNAVHQVPLQDLREYLGSHESNDRVRTSLTNLSRIQLEFDYIDTDGDRKWGSGSLIVVSGHERDQEGLGAVHVAALAPALAGGACEVGAVVDARGAGLPKQVRREAL